LYCAREVVDTAYDGIEEDPLVFTLLRKSSSSVVAAWRRSLCEAVGSLPGLPILACSRTERPPKKRGTTRGGLLTDDNRRQNNSARLLLLELCFHRELNKARRIKGAHSRRYIQTQRHHNQRHKAANPCPRSISSRAVCCFLPTRRKSIFGNKRSCRRCSTSSSSLLGFSSALYYFSTSILFMALL